MDDRSGHALHLHGEGAAVGTGEDTNLLARSFLLPSGSAQHCETGKEQESGYEQRKSVNLTCRFALPGMGLVLSQWCLLES